MFTRKGFTLTEILIAMTLTGLIILAVASVDFASQRFFGMTRGESQVHDEVRIAMEHIVTNLQKGVGDMTNPGTIGSPPAADNSRGFYIFDNGNLANTGSRIQIKKDSNTIQYNYDSANKKIIYDPDINSGGDEENLTDTIVTTCNFSFASNPNEVVVTITARLNPSQAVSQENPETTLTSSVVLRAMPCN